MRMRTTLVVALALLAGACKTTSSTSVAITGTPRLEPVPASMATPAAAPAGPAATAFSPAGKWTLGLVAQGNSLEVVLDLVKLSDGTWTGTLSSDVFPPIPISKAVLTGKQLVATFAAPTGDQGSMTLNFDGDNADGEWSMPGDGSKVSGKRN